MKDFSIFWDKFFTVIGENVQFWSSEIAQNEGLQHKIWEKDMRISGLSSILSENWELCPNWNKIAWLKKLWNNHSMNHFHSGDTQRSIGPKRENTNEIIFFNRKNKIPGYFQVFQVFQVTLQIPGYFQVFQVFQKSWEPWSIINFLLCLSKNYE